MGPPLNPIGSPARHSRAFGQSDLQSAGQAVSNAQEVLISAERGGQGMSRIGGMKSIGEMCDSENRVLMKQLCSSSLAAVLAQISVSIHISEASVLVISTDKAKPYV